MKKDIYDEMRREGEILFICGIIGVILLVLSFLYAYANNKKILDKDICLMIPFYGILSIYFLINYIYSITYKVIISQDEICLKTLFSKKKIMFSNIESYNCKKNRKSVFYQFIFFANEKRIIIYTRYKNELEEILKENNIKQITK